jgi:tRNA(Ile)-lysidine synthase
MNTGVENMTRNGRSGLSHKDPDPLALAFEERWPRSEWADDVVLVGVSGGVDSVALLELIVRFAPDLDRVKVLHCNHGLRGEESDGDESFVIEHCLDRGVECLSIRIHASELVSTSEDALRRIRSRHYIETAKQLGARWIVLGHHRDDNLETFFLRLFRGSGPRGLAGIPERRAVSKANHRPIELVRPLLSVPKKDLQEWLIHQGIPFREDSSNRLAPYQRNRLRNELIPVLDNLYGPGWRKHVLQLMGSMSQQTEEQAAKARSILDRYWKGEGEAEQVVIPLTTLLGEEWDVSREMILAIWHDKGWSLRPWTKKHWDRLQAFFLDASRTTHPRRLDLPGKIRLLVRRGNVYFERITDS